MAWEDTAQILRDEAADSTQVVIKLIKQRLKNIPKIQQELLQLETELTGGLKLKAAEKKKLLKAKAVGETTLYRLKSDIGKEVDKLNRALGELLTAKGKEQYLLEGGLFEKIFSQDAKGSDLTKNLAAFETKLSGYTDAIKSGVKRFTVGHHQHLATLRNLALESSKNLNPKWWSQYTTRLAELGYEIGDQGIIRLARHGHKNLQKYKTGPMAGQLNIDGFLKDLGITQDTPGFKELYKASKEIMAHAGGTGGYKIPLQFAHLSVDEAIEASEDILAIEKARGQQGQLFTDLIRNWNTRIKNRGGPVTTSDIEELTRLTKSIETVGQGKNRISLKDFADQARVIEKSWLDKITQRRRDIGIENQSILGFIPKKAISTVASSVNDLMNLPGARPIAAATTFAAKTATKTLAGGLDVLPGITGATGLVSETDIATKTLHALDVGDALLSTAAWFPKAAKHVGTPLATLMVGKTVGEIQEGGDRKLREEVDEEHTGNIGGSLIGRPLGWRGF